MSLHSHVSTCVPVADDVVFVDFNATENKEVVRKLTDAHGKEISSEKVRVPVIRPIPHEEFENRGFRCELFSYENQLRAGTDLMALPVGSARFIGVDVFDASEQINMIDFDKISVQPKTVETNENND